MHLYHKKYILYLLLKQTRIEIETVGTEDWYKRYENNGWRPIETDLIDPRNPLTYDTNNKREEFHYDRRIRKINKQQKLKERKRKWYKKMYEEGMMKDTNQDGKCIII